MTLGDAGLECEVLAMFAAQARELMAALAGLPPEAGSLAHKLKGSARGIGAFAVAEAAEELEAALRAGRDAGPALAGLEAAVTAARDAIDAMLRRC
jgi:HPt (histidine-containing phosphotransfer) domain-containing protein